MARYLFLSAAAWGHVDFGGLGMVRLAGRLRRSGHVVEWGFTTRLGRLERGHLRQRIAQEGISFVRWPSYLLHPPGRTTGPARYAAKVRQGIELTARHIRQDGIDVVAADRRSTHVTLAAHLAGAPWAAIGSDGRSWIDVEEPSSGSRHAMPGKYLPGASPLDALCRLLGARGLPKACLESAVLYSPYLNLNFFPRAFFDAGRREARPHTHFLGSGAIRRRAGRRGDRIVVSFGNSMRHEAKVATLEAIATVIEDRGSKLRDSEFLILTGRDRSVFQAVRGSFRKTRRVEVRPWQEYETAFAGARIAVSHGGTSIVWEAMAQGIALLVVGPSWEDQRFNAAQLERHGLGLSVPLKDIGARRVEEAMERLVLGDQKNRGSGRFRRLLESGGGVDAGARLMEALAGRREPARACVVSPCCC